jgi:glycerophosphoryl diester phosphodiesterase
MNVEEDEVDFSNYLMATIRLPVRITKDGNLMALHDYADIVINEVDCVPAKTSTSVYDMVAKYADEHPAYLEKIVLEQTLSEAKDAKEVNQDKSLTEDRIVEQDKSSTVDEKFAVELHEFPFIRRRQKPKNMTFRLRHKVSNFTKKAYCQ